MASIVGMSLLVVLVCSGVAAVAAITRVETWTSSARVVYGTQSSDVLLGRDSLPDNVDSILATQAQVVLGDVVMSAAADALGISPSALPDVVEVENVTDSNVLTISVSAESAPEAAERAQVVADSYVSITRETARQSLGNQADALDQPITDLRALIAAAPQRGVGSDTSQLNASLNSVIQQQSQLRAAAGTETGPVQVLAAAQTPSSPSSIGVATAAVIGAGLGIVLVLGLWLVLGRPLRDSDGSRVAPTS